MDSREKGSTEVLEIQVKEWWDAGTPAIPKGAANVLQMRARRDARCRQGGPWSPPPSAPPKAQSQAGLLAMWVMAGLGLKSWTMKLLLSLEG